MPTEQEIVDIKTSVAAAAASSEGQKLLSQDISATTTAVANTLEKFKHIYADLGLVDKSRQTSFQAEWNPLYDEFFGILGKSKTLASQVSAVLGRYSGTMVDMIEAEAAPVDMRANYVEETGKLTSTFDGDAKLIEKSLAELQVKLSKIKTKLDPAAAAQKQEAELKQEIAKGVKIRQGLDAIDKEIALLLKGLDIDAVSLGLQAIPLVGLFLLAAVAKKNKELQAKIDDIKKRREALLKDLNASNAKEAEIRATLASLSSSEVIVRDISSLDLGKVSDVLPFFSGIWHAIKKDSESITAWLRAPDFKYNQKIPSAFVMLKSGGVDYYKFLVNAADKYAIGLGKYSK